MLPMPVSIQSCECCPVVVNWYSMLCHTQCSRHWPGCAVHARTEHWCPEAHNSTWFCHWYPGGEAHPWGSDAFEVEVERCNRGTPTTPMGSAPEQQPLTTPENLMPWRLKSSDATEEPPMTPAEPAPEQRPLRSLWVECLGPQHRRPRRWWPMVRSPAAVSWWRSLRLRSHRRSSKWRGLCLHRLQPHSRERALGALWTYTRLQRTFRSPVTPGRGWWGKPVVEEPLPTWVPDVAALCSCPEVADALQRHAAATEALTMAVQAKTAQQQATQTLLERLGERLAPMPQHPVNSRRHREVSPDWGHDHHIREARSRLFHRHR